MAEPVTCRPSRLGRRRRAHDRGGVLLGRIEDDIAEVLHAGEEGEEVLLLLERHLGVECRFDLSEHRRVVAAAARLPRLAAREVPQLGRVLRQEERGLLGGGKAAQHRVEDVVATARLRGEGRRVGITRPAWRRRRRGARRGRAGGRARRRCTRRLYPVPARTGEMCEMRDFSSR